MKRNSNNFIKYKKTCEEVIERADERCEVMIDEFGDACTNLEKKRCGKMIPFNQAKAINFLHTETRNGKPDDWVLDKENIIYGCEKHHIEEERTGKRVERCNYEEVYYVPDTD